MDSYRIGFEFFVNLNHFSIEAFYPIRNNGCCDKDFFILTSNPTGEGRINYSCQCGCGGWCTNGHATAQEAVDEYRAMCSRYQAQKRGAR